MTWEEGDAKDPVLARRRKPTPELVGDEDWAVVVHHQESCKKTVSGPISDTGKQ